MGSDKRRHPRAGSSGVWRRRAGAASVAVLAALLLCALLFPVAAQAKSGHWKSLGQKTKQSTPTDPQHGGTTTTYWEWAFIDDETGETVKYGTSMNEKYEPPVPDGYERTEQDTSYAPGAGPAPTYEEHKQQEEERKDLAQNGFDEQNTKLSEDPKFDLLKGDSYGRWMAHMAYGAVHNLTQGLMDMTKAVLGVMDPMGLLSEGLDSPNLSPVTRAVGIVAKNVARPIALAFLVVVFAISYLRLVDFRRGLRPGQEYLGQVLGTVVTFAIAASLIVNVDVILRGIYVLSATLVNGLNNVLSQNGIQSGLKVVADQISGAYMDGLENLTYSQAASMLFYIIGAGLIVFESFKTAVTVIVTVAQRFVSLFLRMSVSPVPMAFFVSQDTRATGWAFLKKFGAVSFQALLLIVTIVVAGFVATVVINWGSQALTSLGATGPFEQIAASAIPTVAALTLVRTAVGKTEELASSLFGTR